MFPSTPISNTNRPPRFKARATLAITARASFIQCSAAFENTASKGCSKRISRASPSMNFSFGKFCLASATIDGEASMPMTAAPRSAICAVR